MDENVRFSAYRMLKKLERKQPGAWPRRVESGPCPGSFGGQSLFFGWREDAFQRKHRDVSVFRQLAA